MALVKLLYMNEFSQMRILTVPVKMMMTPVEVVTMMVAAVT